VIGHENKYICVDYGKIKENLLAIHQRIEKACEQASRNLGRVKLLLATKTVAADRIALTLK